MIKELLRRKLDSPINVAAGDTIELNYVNEEGQTEKVLSKTIDHTRQFDTAIVIEVHDELGLHHGLGGVFGKAKKDAG